MLLEHPTWKCSRVLVSVGRPEPETWISLLTAASKNEGHQGSVETPDSETQRAICVISPKL